jgi:ABC-type bacteriocin/lantibiotic exporter with double-glycine peptidase domain
MPSYVILVLAATIGADGPQQKPDIDVRCGSYCLYVALKAFDCPVESFAELDGKLGEPSLAGYSLGQLDEAARVYGAHTLGVETTIENLQRRPGRFACLTLVGDAHFVLMADVRDEKVSIIDPPESSSIPLDTFRSRWSGTALLISDRPLLREEDLPQPFPWVTLLAVAAATTVVLGTFILVRRARGRQSA